MRRLVCVFVVRKLRRQVASRRGPFTPEVAQPFLHIKDTPYMYQPEWNARRIGVIWCRIIPSDFVAMFSLWQLFWCMWVWTIVLRYVSVDNCIEVCECGQLYWGMWVWAIVLRYMNFDNCIEVCDSGWVVTWFLLGYTVRKNGGLLSTPMF